MPILYLYSLTQKKVPEKSGLNWGYSDGHVCKEDAYIAVTTSFIRNNPNFFGEPSSRIIVHWDDGVTMDCLLEGTQTVNDEECFKQISSYNDKSVIGVYLRDRLGGMYGRKVTMDDLNTYGRNNITVSHLVGNEYLFDFSV